MNRIFYDEKEVQNGIVYSIDELAETPPVEGEEITAVDMLSGVEKAAVVARLGSQGLVVLRLTP